MLSQGAPFLGVAWLGSMWACVHVSSTGPMCWHMGCSREHVWWWWWWGPERTNHQHLLRAPGQAGPTGGLRPVVVVPTPPPMTLNGIRLSPPPTPGAWEHLVSSDVDLGSPRTGQGGLCARTTTVCKGQRAHAHTHLVSLAARGRGGITTLFCTFSVSPAAFSYLFNS